DSDGSISVTAADGVDPYTFLWSTGNTGSSIDNLAQGSYGVTVTDANGCTSEDSYDIGDPVTIELVTTLTNQLACNGDNDAIISAVANGGQAPLTFVWSDGQMGRIATNLSAGNYTVSVTDANGCSVETTQVVMEPDEISLAIEKTDASCGEASNGSISITPSGGTPDYTFAWSTGATTSTITDLSPGDYALTVTDANQCSVTESTNIADTGGTPLMAIAVPVRDVTCPGGFDGAASIIAAGGLPPYIYTWSDGQQGTAATNLIGGVYTATATDANGCTIVRDVTISEPEEFSIGITKADVACNGDSNGSARLNVSGGTAPYSFEWSNGVTGSESINGLAAGSYGVTVTDFNGCTTERTVTINEPDPVSVEVEVLDDPNDPNNPNDPCTGSIGQATAMPAGGTAPYSFLWSTGATTETVTGLAPGDYVVTVTDAFGCTAEKSIQITSFPALMIMTSGTDVSCAGADDGTASATANGGLAPYTFAWSNGASGADLTGLAGGDYEVTVTDANGCTANTSVSIGENSSINISTMVTDVACNGESSGDVFATISGGTEPYTFAWSNGSANEDLIDVAAGDYTLNVTDNKGCTAMATVTVTEPPAINISFDIVGGGCTDATATADVTALASGGAGAFATYAWSDGQTTETATDLANGDYSVTVTDVSGCTAVATVNVNVSSGLDLTIDKKDIRCNGETNGMATAIVSGGTIPLTYAWSNGSTDAQITGLAAGDYSVTVTDANGCSAEASTTIIEPFMFKIDFAKADVVCNGDANGSALAQGWGGTAPYTYLWSTGETTEEITNLTAGTYGATVTDANGCEATGEITIEETDPVSVTVDVADTGCVVNATTSTTANASGGNGDYSYLWSDGQTTQTATGLASGSYGVTVTDANGCTASTTV
ncbi:MAG: hypothetical protein AAFO94_08500, partial [Bacteroidota bacterium]